jgi:periplasmic mercuric ion binding protein
MKKLRLFLVIAILSAFGTMTFAQTETTKPSLKTDIFKVYGKCEMCKSRIEKTLKTDGVTTSNWVVKTNMLTVTYDPSKTSSDVLGKKLASVGHDTEKFKASDDVYTKLPGCCHYERVK